MSKLEDRNPKNKKEVEFQEQDVSGYPAHVESFETYYYLGESRTLKETAIIRFQQLVPNCPPDDPNFETKFASFYRKIKR